MTTSTQQGDIYLFNTIDGGEISVEDGLVQMGGDLNTSSYLALFGGNIEDPGQSDTINEWWGNKLERDSDFKYRSETQYFLTEFAPSSSNLLKLEETAKRDLQYLINKGIASSIDVSATIPESRNVQIECTIITTSGESENFVFTEIWE